MGDTGKTCTAEFIMPNLVPQDPNDEPASVLLDKIRLFEEIILNLMI